MKGSCVARAIEAALRAHERDVARRTVLLAAKIKASTIQPWWRWTTWMAAAIAIQRIEAA